MSTCRCAICEDVRREIPPTLPPDVAEMVRDMREGLTEARKHATHMACYDQMARSGMRCAEETMELIDRVLTKHAATIARWLPEGGKNG